VLKVRERKVDTLEEALRVVQRFEIVKNAVALNTGYVTADKSPIRTRPRMNCRH